MKLLTILAALLVAGAAQAQTTVWRCGADGRTYSDTPCPQGRTVTAADTRSAADVSAAQEVAEREQTLAQKLVQQRKAREAQLPTMAGIGYERPKPAVKPAKSPKSQKSQQSQKSQKSPSKLQASRQSPAASGTWQAIAPASR